MSQEPEKRATFIQYATEADKGVKELWSLLGVDSQITEPDILTGAPTSDVIDDDYQDDLSKGLGRLISIDFSDSNYNITDGLLDKTEKAYRYWRTGKVLDLEDKPYAVAYAGEQLLAASPITGRFYKTPEELYLECQKVDEWRDKEHEGTSLRALMKVLQTNKLIFAYRWGYTVDDVCSYILQKGPVILGINWYASMFYPDAITSFLTVRGSSARRSGNAVLIKGCNAQKLCPDGSRGAFRLVGNWGTKWGDNGYAWLSYKDAAKLLADWGEVVAADEINFEIEEEG